MITVLTGDNTFEIDHALKVLCNDFSGTVEKYDGENLLLNQLPDLLMGSTLFADKRLIIIRELSQNKSIWPILPDWLGKISDDIDLVLIEPSMDKRTTAYKALKSQAIMKEFSSWSDNDYHKAEQWAIAKSKEMNLTMTDASIKELVRWVGPSQWRINEALEKLSLIDDSSVEAIHEYIDPNLSETAFNLLDMAINKQLKSLEKTIQLLRDSEDGFRTIGLLASQAFNLAVVVSAGKDNNPSKDFGIHPFALSKVQPLAKSLGKKGVAKVVEVIDELDLAIKKSQGEPWDLIQIALYKITKL